MLATRVFLSRATTMRAASLNPEVVTHLDLSRSEDLKCLNIICAKYEGTCVCKLARWMMQLNNRLVLLSHVSLCGNNLEFLPPSLFDLRGLTRLDLKDNSLSAVPEDISKLVNLKVIDLSHNKITSIAALASCPALEEVIVTGNPILDRESAGLSTRVRVITS